MPVVTIKEFADLCGIEPKIVHTYVTRGKVIKRKDKLIDTANPINATLLIYKGAKIEGVMPRASTDKPKQKDVKIKDKESDGEDIDNSEATYSQLDLNKLRAQKLEEEITQLRLKNQKLEGEVVDTALISKATYEVVNAYRTTLYLAAENVLKNNIRDLGGNNDRLTKAIADLKALFNQACSEAIENVKDSIERILQ